MPIVKKRVNIAAGATSEQILQGTTYEYVTGGTQLIVAAADASSTYAGDITMRFNINNTEFANDAIVSEKVSGEAFGYRGGYVLNDTVTGPDVRYRPILTFTNNDTGARDVEVAVFISTQPN
jgi:hypothetical protein